VPTILLQLDRLTFVFVIAMANTTTTIVVIMPDYPESSSGPPKPRPLFRSEGREIIGSVGVEMLFVVRFT
jgi:hypothetical protein